ncbi:hypothetical protein [Arthrobacter sp. NA-172]|uniref:hypothetical protein n=1 Tax=Arthrobacter sp. NA-172 TaxID=3367524 RepID=UPI00375466D8
MTPDDWAALAKELIKTVGAPNWAEEASFWLSSVTLLIAAIAAGGGLYRLSEAKQLRIQTNKLERKKAQPYVVAFMDVSFLGPEALDVVIRNYGQTAATDVRADFTPRLTMWTPTKHDVFIPEEIPMLAPGQEWRTLFDFSNSRLGKKEADSRFEGVVRYKGIDGDPLESKCILDWEAYRNKTWVQTFGLHELAKAATDMRNQMKSWTEGNDGLSVIVRSGDKKDGEERALFEQVRREQDLEDSNQSPPLRRVSTADTE